MTTNHCQCGQPAVCFCAGIYYCLEHLPTTIPQNDFLAPLGSQRYAQATDMPDILCRLERVERIIAAWEANSER